MQPANFKMSNPYGVTILTMGKLELFVGKQAEKQPKQDQLSHWFEKTFGGSSSQLKIWESQLVH